MKSLNILITLSLITFSFCDLTFNLATGQTKTTSASLAISILVTNDDANNAVTLTAVSGLKIIKSGSAAIALDCSGVTSTTIAQSESETISCTAASPPAGTYTLDGTATPSTTPSLTVTCLTTNSMIINDAQQQQQSGITISLKTGQSVNTGSNVEVKLTLTSTAVATVKTLTGLSLVKSDSDSVTSALTCSTTTAVSITASGSADFSCTAATLSTAGTYKLTGNNVAGTDTSDGALSVTLTVSSTNTITVTTASENPGNNNGGDNSSKYLNIYSLFILLLFF